MEQVPGATYPPPQSRSCLSSFALGDDAEYATPAPTTAMSATATNMSFLIDSSITYFACRLPPGASSFRLERMSMTSSK